MIALGNTVICEFVPVYAMRCPAMLTCVLSMNARVQPMPGCHRKHSVLVSWEVSE